ncbi:unnamed protein product [Caenorhabditis auriculariae]|uniref:Uncharacterized protein n=1 Tax=Caenorhabditis auriculariae TaxID=2777116 RepID=A0A8S1GRM7_9PELO|nr:unnamed protein product [Caenorhabditis auriculariae]
MASSRFELLCIVLLGVGQMCIMTGYDTQSFILESVIHSVNERYPGLISKYAGYYGQAVCWGTYMIATIFTPSLLNYLSPKMTLFLGSLCYTLFQIGFFFLNSYYYYITSALMGVGMLLGGGILALVFALTSASGSNHGIYLNDTLNFNSTIPFTEEKERSFSDKEILLMYAAFAAVTIFANITFLVMPSKEVDNCIEGRNKNKTTFIEQMHRMYSAFSSRKTMLLSAVFVNLGLWTSFWLSVYPTTLTFNINLSEKIYLPAIYSVGVGTGEIIMGFFIASMSKRKKDFGLQPTMTIGCSLACLTILLITVSTPVDSPMRPTAQLPLLFQPNRIIVFLIALMIGLADSALNNVRTVICAIVMPDRRAQTFSISKFYQALGGSVLLFLSSKMTIYHYTCILLVSSILATVTFFHVAKKTQKMERKFTVEQLNRNRVPL